MHVASNIREIFDLMSYCEEREIPAIILSLDFEKCFDKVEHNALIGAMKFFDMSDYLIKWTNIVCKNREAVIQNNGHFSDPIKLEKGIRQGGPASSLYFLICAETLAIHLKSDPHIKGVMVNDFMELLLGQFTDDMDIYMSFNQNCLNAVRRALDSFQQHSGFTVNYDKTQIYRIGSLKNSSAELYTQRKVRWTNEEIPVLGVTISHDLEVLLKANYALLLLKVETILSTWASRSLSLFDKIQVVNMLIASLFVHKMTVLPSMSEEVIKKMESAIVKFLWNAVTENWPTDVAIKEIGRWSPVSKS